MTFSRILELCERHAFLKSFRRETLKIGPVGALLQENLQNEWFYNMVINRDNSVFFSKGTLEDTFEYAKSLCQERLPFGIAQILEDEKNENVQHFNQCLVVNREILLKTTMYIEPSKSTQFFHQWQRQRKMWWRKFSAAPGRYILSDIHTSANNDSNVEIRAEYSWGSQLLESISLSSDSILQPKQLLANDGRKKVKAHSVSSEIYLSCMLINALCDSYDEGDFQGSSRPLLRLHRKLAPYKISFSAVSSSNTSTDELGELALYLCRKLRTNHVSSLLLPSAIHNSLNEQWAHYDQLGVPYTVVLNENTLKNGIALLRSRDTTLQEQVHVSTLPEYVEQLFKNY